MSSRTCRRRFGSGLALLAGVWLAGVVLAPAALAIASQEGDWSTVETRLRADVRGRFRVLPTRTGLILLPRSTREGIQSVEVGDGTVAVNGAIRTGAELRDLLGADADLVVRLSFLDPERRRLLLLGDEAPPEAVAPDREPSAVPREDRRSDTPAEQGRQYSREVETRIRIGGSVTVASDERVRGPVVVIGGRADILGRVDDAVVVVGGPVHLGEGAVVAGDVTVIGGTVERGPGAEVRGQVNIVGIDFPAIDFRPFRPGHAFGGWWRGWAPGWPSPPWRLAGTLFRFSVIGLVLAVLVLIARRGTGRIERTVIAEPWKAGLVGLFAELLILPVLVLSVVILTVSIIGIPLLLLVPFAVLVLLFGFLLGFAGVATAIGRAAERVLGWAPQNRVVLLIIGLAGVWVLTLAGRVIWLAGWPAWAVASVVLGIGFVVEYVAWTVGFGAALLTRMGSRDRHPERVEAYPPPMPDIDAQPSGPSPA